LAPRDPPRSGSAAYPWFSRADSQSAV